MNKKHAKSPCCGKKIRRFGGRRRQCVICGRTWRIRPHQRGRKRRRVSSVWVVRYLSRELLPMNALGRINRCAPDRYERRLLASRNQFSCTTVYPPLPTRKPLIIIADAMIECISGSWYTVYLILVKRPAWTNATIAPPIILKGTETRVGWCYAFNQLPPSIHRSITAIVCDGHAGIIQYARKAEWLIQACHFHLLMRLNGRRSRSPWSFHREEGRRLYALAWAIITTRDTTILRESIRDLEELGWDTASPQLKQYINGFLNRIEEYRTYLAHPELNLPVTTNSIESLNSIIHALKGRARGFRTIHALSAWIEALVKHRRRVTCNRTNQPNYCG